MPIAELDLAAHWTLDYASYRPEEEQGRDLPVHKRRILFLAGRTRIHLDRVAGLGDFLELEVVLEESESAEAGAREAHELMARLGVDSSQLIEGAYVDLLAAMT